MNANDILPENLRDGSLRVACETRGQALELTRALYERPGTFHVEHYPATDDDTGEVTHTTLAVRQLTHDRDTGWWSSDVRDSPDVDLRE